MGKKNLELGIHTCDTSCATEVCVCWCTSVPLKPFTDAQQDIEYNKCFLQSGTPMVALNKPHGAINCRRLCVMSLLGNTDMKCGTS